MADQIPDYPVGWIFPDAKLTTVEYAADITAGDPLRITGANDDGIPKVQKQSGQTAARYVALYDGVSGLLTDALISGTVKAKSVKKWGAGGIVSAHDGGFEVDASATTSDPCGFGYKAVAADGDFTLFYFHGVRQR